MLACILLTSSCSRFMMLMMGALECHLGEHPLLYQQPRTGHALGGFGGGGPPLAPLADHPVPPGLCHVSSHHTGSIVSARLSCFISCTDCFFHQVIKGICVVTKQRSFFDHMPVRILAGCQFWQGNAMHELTCANVVSNGTCLEVQLATC